MAVTLQGADQGDATTIEATLPEVIEQLEAVAEVTDKGYHSKQSVMMITGLGLRTYISEPNRGRQCWTGQQAKREAVYANRRRFKGKRGKRLMRLRGERLERPHALLYKTGAMRRTHLRGHGNILKRVLLHVAACNLGLWMRTLTGFGTPRGLQSRLAVVFAYFFTLWDTLRGRVNGNCQSRLDLRSLAIPGYHSAFLPCIV